MKVTLEMENGAIPVSDYEVARDVLTNVVFTPESAVNNTTEYSESGHGRARSTEPEPNLLNNLSNPSVHPSCQQVLVQGSGSRHMNSFGPNREDGGETSRLQQSDTRHVVAVPSTKVDEKVNMNDPCVNKNNQQNQDKDVCSTDNICFDKEGGNEAAKLEHADSGQGKSMLSCEAIDDDDLNDPSLAQKGYQRQDREVSVNNNNPLDKECKGDTVILEHSDSGRGQSMVSTELSGDVQDSKNQENGSGDKKCVEGSEDGNDGTRLEHSDSGRGRSVMSTEPSEENNMCDPSINDGVRQTPSQTLELGSFTPSSIGKEESTTLARNKDSRGADEDIVPQGETAMEGTMRSLNETIKTQTHCPPLEGTNLHSSEGEKAEERSVTLRTSFKRQRHCKDGQGLVTSPDADSGFEGTPASRKSNNFRFSQSYVSDSQLTQLCSLPRQCSFQSKVKKFVASQNQPQLLRCCQSVPVETSAETCLRPWHSLPSLENNLELYVERVVDADWYPKGRAPSAFLESVSADNPSPFLHYHDRRLSKSVDDFTPSDCFKTPADREINGSMSVQKSSLTQTLIVQNKEEERVQQEKLHLKNDKEIRNGITGLHLQTDFRSREPREMKQAQNGCEKNFHADNKWGMNKEEEGQSLVAVTDSLIESAHIKDVNALSDSSTALMEGQTAFAALGERKISCVPVVPRPFEKAAKLSMEGPVSILKKDDSYRVSGASRNVEHSETKHGIATVGQGVSDEKKVPRAEFGLKSGGPKITRQVSVDIASQDIQSFDDNSGDNKKEDISVARQSHIGADDGFYTPSNDMGCLEDSPNNFWVHKDLAEPLVIQTLPSPPVVSKGQFDMMARELEKAKMDKLELQRLLLEERSKNDELRSKNDKLHQVQTIVTQRYQEQDKQLREKMSDNQKLETAVRYFHERYTKQEETARQAQSQVASLLKIRAWQEDKIKDKQAEIDQKLQELADLHTQHLALVDQVRRMEDEIVNKNTDISRQKKINDNLMMMSDQERRRFERDEEALKKKVKKLEQKNQWLSEGFDMEQNIASIPGLSQSFSLDGHMNQGHGVIVRPDSFRQPSSFQEIREPPSMTGTEQDTQEKRLFNHQASTPLKNSETYAKQGARPKTVKSDTFKSYTTAPVEEEHCQNCYKKLSEFNTSKEFRLHREKCE